MTKLYIKPVTKYEVEDGTLFDSEHEAVEYCEQKSASEELYKLIDKLMFDTKYTKIDECEVHDWMLNNANWIRETLLTWDKK